MSKTPMKSFVSDKSGAEADYMVIDFLPSQFRSYDQKQVFVRGLYFEEVKALSRYIGPHAPPEVDYVSLEPIYSDCVRGIPFRDLEPIDIKFLMMVSSVWTTDDFGWTPNVACPHEVRALKEPLASGVEPTESDYEQRACTGFIQEPIKLDDFDFSDPKHVTTLPVPINIQGKEYNIGALTVGGLIDKQVFLDSEEGKGVDADMVDYALMIKNSDLTLSDKVKAIRYGDRNVLDIEQIDKELLISIAPVSKRCNSCRKASRIYIGLDQIKAFP